jgi:tRNA A58 N-methylase Trm61
MTEKAVQLANIAMSHSEKAKEELKIFTLTFLEVHWFDNLSNLIEKAVNKGYVAAEWIDLLTVGIFDPETIIEWAYKVIKNQGLKGVLEPYYNNVNHRLGIILNRSVLKNKGLLKNGSFLMFPLELQKK